MKLDKIKFAKVIGAIERQHAINMSIDELERIDDLIDIDVPEATPIYPEASDIHELMRLMAEGTSKIEAICVHRKLTGYGLKDSKDAVEKYWVPRPVQEY